MHNALDSEYIGYASPEHSERLEIVAIKRVYIRMCHIRTYDYGQTSYEAYQSVLHTKHTGHEEKSRIHDDRRKCGSSRMPTMVFPSEYTAPKPYYATSLGGALMRGNTSSRHQNRTRATQ